MSLLADILRGDADPDELVDRFGKARRAEEEARRAAFAPFGVAADDACPATAVFHRHSRIEHTSLSPVVADELRALTLEADDPGEPGGEVVELPPAPADGELGRALLARRSIREFDRAPLPGELLAGLLGLGCGVTGPAARPPRRAAPSAGALYPLAVYPVVLAVDGVAPGLYRYQAAAHRLARMREVRGADELKASLGPAWRGEPAVVVVLTARLARLQKKYGERAYRFALLECGHVAQNLVLLATAAGLASLPLGGFVDREMDRFLGIDGQREIALYAVAIGRPGASTTNREGMPME